MNNMIVLKRKDNVIYIMKSEVIYIKYTKIEKEVEVHFKNGNTIIYSFVNDIDFK